MQIIFKSNFVMNREIFGIIQQIIKYVMKKIRYFIDYETSGGC